MSHSHSALASVTPEQGFNGPPVLHERSHYFLHLWGLRLARRRYCCSVSDLHALRSCQHWKEWPLKKEAEYFQRRTGSHLCLCACECVGDSVPAGNVRQLHKSALSKVKQMYASVTPLLWKIHRLTCSSGGNAKCHLQVLGVALQIRPLRVDWLHCETLFFPCEPSVSWVKSLTGCLYLSDCLPHFPPDLQISLSFFYMH